MKDRIVKCEGCGKKFTTNVACRKYCSTACSQATWKTKRALTNGVCRWCGKKMGRWRSKFCSAACVASDWESKRPLCKRKGCTNHVSHPAFKFCSRECWLTRVHGPRVCPTCGEEFVQQSVHQGRYCRKCYNLRRVDKRGKQRVEPTYRANTSVNGRGPAVVDFSQ